LGIKVKAENQRGKITEMTRGTIPATMGEDAVKEGNRKRKKNPLPEPLRRKQQQPY